MDAMNDEGALFVTEDVQVLQGVEARSRLIETSDALAIDLSGGIHHVDQQRWEMAQRCERHHCFDDERHATGGNYNTLVSFDGYRAIAGRQFTDVIELGCGPFTDIRWIARKCRIDQVELLDPLLNDYLTHRNRNYNRKCVWIAPPWRSYQKIHKRLPWVVRLVGRRLPIRKLWATTIEDFDGSEYDLVILINVLEHCRDIDRIFQRVSQTVRSGGILIFGDRTYDPEELASVGPRQWDAAHPLRPTTVATDLFLSRFEPLFDARSNVSAGLYERCTQRWFIGQKP
jgi:SAM-dependent methyltransferase